MCRRSKFLAKRKRVCCGSPTAGVNIVSNGIIAHNDLIKSDPDLLHKFVPASIKGFLYARQHIDDAVAVVKKYSPTSDPAILKSGFEVSWKSWVTPNTKGKPLGWEADENWASTIDVLKQYGGVSTPLTTSQALHQRLRADWRRIRTAGVGLSAAEQTP